MLSNILKEFAIEGFTVIISQAHLYVGVSHPSEKLKSML